MLCLLHHIREDVFKNAQNKHYIQVNNVIKSVFDRWTEKDLHGALDTFWSEYTLFNHKNDPFDRNDLICNSKDITDGKSHIWHQKYALVYTIVIGFVACRVTSKIIGIGSAERSWGDIKTIKPGNISALSSEISENQSIVYTSACIEEARTGRTLSHINNYNGSHSHTWNDWDQAFDDQLY